MFFQRLLLCVVVACVVLVVTISSEQECGATQEGLRMVGVAGIPADSLDYGGVGDSLRNRCWFHLSHTTEPSFWQANLNEWTRVDRDLDLLLSASFSGDAAILQDDIDEIISALDKTEDNLLDEPQTDLELIVNYFSIASDYDSTGVDYNFLLFPSCSELGVRISHRDHFDFYLTRGGVDTEYGGGAYTAGCRDPVEDDPLHADSLEYHHNSFRVSTGQGDGWHAEVAEGAVHELQHALWESDKSEYGSAWNHGDFNEFFASAAALLAKLGEGTIQHDKPYAQSQIELIGVTGEPGCDDPGTSGSACPEWADQQDCRTGYVTWATFAAYLVEQFSGSPYSDDLLYRWARSREGPSGQMTRDMCGLARVLDDSDYSGLGGDDGDYRVCKVFHDFSVARWVDDDSYSSAYSFGDDISPTTSLGYFAKNDTTTAGTHNCYEIAIPPEFLVGEDNDSTWVSVPGNGSDPAAGCTDGWNDPRDTRYCDNSYCDPVKVRL